MRVSEFVGRFVAVAGITGVLVVAAGPGSSAFSPAPVFLTMPAAPAAVNDGVGAQFYSGVVVDVAHDVSGDIYASGQTITISGDVTGDVIAAGQTITITGNVDGNVRLAGENVTIDGDISRSGTVFAATVNLTGNGSFGDDLVGAAGNIVIAGDIGRDVMVGVGDLTIDGSVGGDVTYTAEADALITDGAVSGTVERIAAEQLPSVEVTPWALFVAWFLGLLYALVAFSLITALMGLLFPRWLVRVTDRLVPTPWKALLVGFVASITVPLGLLVILVTVVGAPLAIAGLLVWGTLTLATFAVSAYYIGRLLFRGNQPPVVKALVGGVVLIIALHIPWLNIAVWAAMVFFGLGAQLLEIYGQRPWHRTGSDKDNSPHPPATDPVAAPPAKNLDTTPV